MINTEVKPICGQGLVSLSMKNSITRTWEGLNESISVQNSKDTYGQKENPIGLVSISRKTTQFAALDHF